MQMQRLKAKLVAAENALSVARKEVETERKAKDDARRVTCAAAPHGIQCFHDDNFRCYRLHLLLNRRHCASGQSTGSRIDSCLPPPLLMQPTTCQL